jgi:DNA-binding MarR family transcriptional regulator
MRTVFDRRVRGLGLTRAQWLALTRLDRRPGASQSELADMMEIEKAPVGRIIDRLEDKGWVERRTDPADRRIKRIYLTDRGNRVRAAIVPIAEATVDDALSALSGADKERLMQLMLLVKATLSGLAETDAPVGAADVDGREDEHKVGVRVQ